MNDDLRADLEQLRDVASAATPGPWILSPSSRGATEVTALADDATVIADTNFWARDATAHEMANAAYIAACDPTTVLALLDERDALRAEVERLRAVREAAQARVSASSMQYERSPLMRVTTMTCVECRRDIADSDESFVYPTSCTDPNLEEYRVCAACHAQHVALHAALTDDGSAG